MAFRKVGGGSGSGGGGGGASQTLANITGTLGTLKGGTGLNATDLGDLRQKLGIANPSNPNDEYLDYCADTRHQPNNTIQRVDADTSNALSDVEDGLIVKVGDDQVMINLADGKQWVRSHTTGSTRTNWSTPVNALLTELVSEAQIRGMADGAIAYTTQTTWLPQYPDNTRPDKVIIARVGEYLIACARYNMWWSPRPTTDTWAEVPWLWEGNSQVPQGLEFSGGVNDEDRIPAGAVAVLGNKENVDQDSAGYILLMTKHTFNATSNGGTSTFTGYFVDDDASKTLKRSTSTITKTTTNWGRTKLDADGIEDAIITSDRATGDPVFHGIIPEISNLGFTGYTRVATQSEVSTRGNVYYDSTQRVVRLRILAEDPHLADLFHEDFEVELKKDDSNYIRGVFDSITVIPGSQGIVSAQFRAEDLETEGTIATGSTIEVLGHKSVITKTDHVLPINLGLDHGSEESGKFVTMNSEGNNFSLATSSLPIGAQIPSTTPTKTSALTVITSGTPTSNQIRINNGSGIAVHVSGDDATNLTAMVSNAITRSQWVMVVKDSNNYIGIKPTASTITSGSVSSIGENIISRVQRGTISANDTVRLWLRPENASKHIVHNFLGEEIIIEPERPHLVYVRQQSGIGGNSVATGTAWNWIVITPPWKIPTGFKIGGHLEIKGGGVANFGQGAERQIVPELMVRHRSGNTIANTSSATWRDLNINPNIVEGGKQLLFRSKVTSGGTAAGQDSWRDYWTYASKPMPMRDLHSDCVDNNFVQFQLGLRKGNTANEDITSIYGFDMTVHVWPPSLVTAS